MSGTEPFRKRGGLAARLTRRQKLTFLVLLAATNVSQAQEIGWPEAVSRLAGERYIAETCVSVLKGTKNDAEIARGRLIYASAKADNDAVISGLLAVLALDQQPISLPTLEAKLQSSTAAIARFCSFVKDLLPPNPEGQKGLLDGILKIPLETLLKSLSEGVAALYNNHRKDGEAARERLRTRLEAERWPDFIKVEAPL